MEAYIDDMVVKSEKVEEHLADLGETFSTFKKHKTMPKCIQMFFWGRVGQVPGLHDNLLGNRSQAGTD